MMKRYMESGRYWIEVEAPTKRHAERVMRKLERAIKNLYALRNGGVGIVAWEFDAPEDPLNEIEDSGEE